MRGNPACRHEDWSLQSLHWLSVLKMPPTQPEFHPRSWGGQGGFCKAGRRMEDCVGSAYWALFWDPVVTRAARNKITRPVTSLLMPPFGASVFTTAVMSLRYGGSVWESNPPFDPRRTESPALKAGKVTGLFSPPMLQEHHSTKFRGRMQLSEFRQLAPVPLWCRWRCGRRPRLMRADDRNVYNGERCRTQ
jgi:hypothetical protein